MDIKCKTVFGIIIISLVIILIVMVRSKHFFKAFILSSFSGIGALFAVNLLREITGFEIGVNPVTLCFSAIGGSPAVILMLISRVFLL